MSEKADERPPISIEWRHDLVCAIGHEVGNHLAGIRLHAHLIEDDVEPRALIATSVGIDHMAGRAAPLLALIRPLLADTLEEGESFEVASLFERLRRDLEDEGTGGVRIRFSADGAGARFRGFGGLHSLLMALVAATAESLSAGDEIQIDWQGQSGEGVLRVVDSGAEEVLGNGAALRGRPLALAIARELLGAVGGSVTESRVGDETEIVLRFPSA